MECRLCMRSEPNVSFVPIHDSSESMVKFIRRCCQIKVEKNDNCPDVICSFCEANLRLCIDFKDVCIQSDRTARLRLTHRDNIKVEEVLLNDLVWDDDVGTSSPKSAFIEGKNSNRERTNVCDTCSLSFDTEKLLKQHVLKFHKEKYTCEVCKKCFRSKAYYKQHAKLHTEETPHKCEMCSLFYVTKCDLKRHMQHHTGANSFNCDVCFKSFLFRSNLKRHMKLHTGERPHKCDKCSKSFGLEYNLKQHMKLHTEDRPFKCEICTKLFVSNRYLKEHVKLHLGNKPHKCEICSKSFVSKSDLKRHVKTHNGKKPHKCDICLKCFALSSYLNMHVKKSHAGVSFVENSQQKISPSLPFAVGEKSPDPIAVSVLTEA